MPNDPLTIEDHMAAVAKKLPNAMPAFRAALAGDAEMKTAAQRRYAAIVPDIADRCHIARRSRAHLRQALQGD